MRCTDRRLRVGVIRAGVASVGLAGVALLGGCSRPAAPVPPPVPPVASAAAASTPAVPAPSLPASQAPLAPPSARLIQPLPPPGPVRNADELRRQAARRIVAANPHTTYLGPVPEALLAIPVLEVELHRDGSVARIAVLRSPRHAKDTVQLAMAAVRRAAPFGNVSHLPRPWRFTETFLFDDDRRFKPRTLDE